jgi:hypothetical protein
MQSAVLAMARGAEIQQLGTEGFYAKIDNFCKM